MTALAGLKVLDFSGLLPAPFGTRILADMGATVLRVEAPARPECAAEAGPARPCRAQATGRPDAALCRLVVQRPAEQHRAGAAPEPAAGHLVLHVPVHGLCAGRARGRIGGVETAFGQAFADPSPHPVLHRGGSCCGAWVGRSFSGGN